MGYTQRRLATIVERAARHFPALVVTGPRRALWFSSYLQTYLERDVRAITNVRDLVTFRRFLSLVAALAAARAP
jgi:predicted AAA+ superfamily ATPase